MYWRWTIPLCLGLACLPTRMPAADWPQFRGPNSSGLSSEDTFPSEWGAEKNVQWKVQVSGVAWSSPIVWGDKIFVTTAITDKQTKPKPGFGPGGGFGRGGFGAGGRPEAPRDEKDKGKDSSPPAGRPPFRPGGFGFGGMGNAKPPDAVYRWEVYCLNRADGKVLWKQTAAEHKPAIPIQSSNTYASETPITDGERVYASFGMHGLYCYDVAGKLLWNKDLGVYPMQFGWGTGSSPALDGDRLFVQCDNEQQSFLVALDKKTGKELWRVPREEKSSWSTPFVWRTPGRTEVVACGGKRVRSHDVATGKLLWELGGMTGPCNATPVAGDDLLYVGSGGPFGNSPLFAVKAGAAGDITLKDKETSNAGVAWYRTKAGPSMASPLLYNGYLYIVEQRGGMVSCYDAKTGEPAYSRQRLPQAHGFTSSPWGHDGKVFCLDEEGQTFVLRAGPKFEVLGQNKLDEMFWSSPAIAGGALFLRGVDHLYCIKQ